MQVDWFTVAAQAINFLILMWLLQRFLYQPILNAIAAREKHIADQLADAKAIEAEAQKTRDDFAQKNEVFDKQKATLLRDAKKAAEAERERLSSQAKEEADAMRSKRKAALEKEIQEMMQSNTKRISRQVFATTGKLLRDLADVSLEERMVAVFITHLQALSAEDLATLGASKPPQPVHVSSAFTLQHEAQTRISIAISDTLHTEQIAFSTIPDLLSGIELSVDGQKLAWSALDYLEQLEGSVKDAA